MFVTYMVAGTVIVSFLHVMFIRSLVFAGFVHVMVTVPFACVMAMVASFVSFHLAHIMAVGPMTRRLPENSDRSEGETD